MCHGSRQMTASGQRSAIGRVIQSASSQGHQPDSRPALCAEQIQERLDRVAVAAERGPHQPAGVVVDDHREVLLTCADRDLVKPELREPGAQVAAGLRLGADAFADPPDRPPRDPHQLADRGRAGVDRQPCGGVVEAAGEPGVVTRPRDRRDHHPVTRALDPRRVGLQETDRRAEIQRPPPAATLAAVIPRAATAAVRAAIPLTPDRPDRDHDRAVDLVDRLHDGLLQPQHPRPRTDAYAPGAHAATASCHRSRP